MFRCFPPGLLCASLSIKWLCKPSLKSCCGKLPRHHCLSFLQRLLRAGLSLRHKWGAEQGCRGAGCPPAGQLSGTAAHPTPAWSAAAAAAAASAGQRGRRGGVRRITGGVKGSFGARLCVLGALHFMAVLTVAILRARRSILMCSRCSGYGGISAIHPEGAQHIRILFSTRKISFGLCLIQGRKGSLLSGCVLRQLLASPSRSVKFWGGVKEIGAKFNALLSIGVLTAPASLNKYCYPFQGL